jgi:hypothetical protein
MEEAIVDHESFHCVQVADASVEAGARAVRDAIRMAGDIVLGERGARMNYELVRVLDPLCHVINPWRDLSPLRHDRLLIERLLIGVVAHSGIVDRLTAERADSPQVHSERPWPQSAPTAIRWCTVKCEVFKCESDAHVPPHTLIPAQGWNWPTEITVCNFHRGEVSKPASRWKWIHDVDGTRHLLLGFGQLELNEYVVLEPPAEAIAYGKGHDVSHPEDNGICFPIKLQRRGSDESCRRWACGARMRDVE